MEVSEFVLKGLQDLANPRFFNDKMFLALTEVSFRSLLATSSDESILDNAEFKQIDRVLLKRCHCAVSTYVLECVKQNADKSTFSTCLEDVKFDPERIDVFYGLYRKNKQDLENLLSRIGRCHPHVRDASWNVEYHIKNSHVHKVNQPSYFITLNVENGGTGSTGEVKFCCTMEQLQDLVGKMKDAAKGLEKATQQ